MFRMKEFFAIAAVLMSGACATHRAALPPASVEAPAPKEFIAYEGGAYVIAPEGAEGRVTP